MGHTIQVWLWAVAFVWGGALPTLSDAVYFSIVTYTTLGYGDITIGPESRIFGAMSAVTGLLNFGLSTAFLVETARSPKPGRTRKATDSRSSRSFCILVKVIVTLSSFKKNKFNLFS